MGGCRDRNRERICLPCPCKCVIGLLALESDRDRDRWWRNCRGFEVEAHARRDAALNIVKGVSMIVFACVLESNVYSMKRERQN